MVLNEGLAEQRMTLPRARARWWVVRTRVGAHLKPLAVSGNPWFGSAGEMVAAAYIKMNKPELAGPLFAAIAKDEQVPETIRGRATRIAGALGADAIAQPATTKE